jgi:glycosyltransferase involved in cell wall biosynthesis
MVSLCTLLARKWDISDIAYRLSTQTHKDFEWVIIDFNYEENKNIFSEITLKHNINLVHRPNIRQVFPYIRDIARNRNEALLHSNGKYIIFLDDYTIIDNDFIENHLEIDGISCGKMYTMKDVVEVDKTQTVSDVLKLSRHVKDSRLAFTKDVVSLVKGPEWTYTGNLGFPKEIARHLNGFDPRLSGQGEDSDFGLRAYNLGYKVFYNPTAYSINLCTDPYPCKTFFDHEHPINFLLENNSKIISDPTIISDWGEVIKKYGVKCVVCKKCGAEYILNPSDFIYSKINNKEFITKKTLFNWRLS